MPKLSLYRPTKSNDYKFLDRTISEMFTIGATDLYVHKYAGVKDNGGSKDFTQPQYDSLDPTNIQDLLFLENRDRKYDSDIYRIRGHYNVQNLDFDLSQFGLFLNNDVIFVTVHYNDMINIIGRKLMVGDVFEMPHLTDYHPLNETIPVALRRYYQITDANFASEGFSQTWHAHLWRIKCEPLVDSQEFSNILEKPTNTDNYLGDWAKTSNYVQGYVVSYGNQNYKCINDILATGPDANMPCYGMPNSSIYWELDNGDSLKDILGRYNKNVQINDAVINEAKRILPKAGYDRSQLYIAPTYADNKPASGYNTVVLKSNPIPTRGVITMMGTSPVIRVAAGMIASFQQINIQIGETVPVTTDTGSGVVGGDVVLTVEVMGPVTGPYGTSDNTYATSDADPSDASFTGIITVNIMDYRADCDPRFRFIARYAPRGFGYVDGYMVGDGTAPNGEPVTSGDTFPYNPIVGEYFLRTDYLPQQLFRWGGTMWSKISSNVRTGFGLDSDNGSLRSTFINNSNVTALTNGTSIPEQQALSSILRLTPD